MESVDKLIYRGYTIEFYEDILGRQVFSYWNDKKIEFGTDNFNYKRDMIRIIDYCEDTISTFTEMPDLINQARLYWFDNGEYRDIKLEFRQRILKVYLVLDEKEVNLDKVLKDANNVLFNLIALLNKSEEDSKKEC